MAHRLWFAAAGLALLLPLGCVHRTVNPPREAIDLSKGYYFHTHQRPHNSGDTLFILCFSGGGTRAAALSFGVLEELNRTPLRRGAQTNRLLDEVDAISSVSGGSFTAAAYALLGDDVFPRLEQGFLKRNVQSQLLARTVNPRRWNRLCSRTYGRSDLAADLYDELLFGGATFADLARNPGAYVVINATDISTGARFGFTQYQFDLLCADLAPVRVAQAVAASSAVPGLLSPVTFNNYAGHCESPSSALIREAATGALTNLSSRARFQYGEMATYLEGTNHPYVHLVDGGVSDNLGIRAVLDGLYSAETYAEVRQHYDLAQLDKVAIVVVNAFSKPDTGWARHEQAPSTLALAVAGATIPMDRYSYETIELLKEQVEGWRQRHARETAGAAQPTREVRFYPIVVSFADLPNPKEREYFMNLHTSFFLPDEAIDRLREVGGRLLTNAPLFQAFLQDLHSRPARDGNPGAVGAGTRPPPP